MPIDIDTLPPMPDELKTSPLGVARPDVVASLPPMPKAEQPPAQPQELPSMAAPVELPPMPKAPEERMYWQLQAEKEKYGLGNSLSPTAMEQRGGIITSRGISDDEVRAFAQHYKLDFDTARKLATLRGAVPPMSEIDSVSELLQAAAGKLNLATGNLAGWVGKKALTDDPAIRNYLDDIGELADGRAGLGEVVAGLLIPGAAIGKAGKAYTVGRKLQAAAGAAATGAGYGLAASKEGKEVEGLAAGAIFGAGLAGAASVAGKVLSRRGKMPDVDNVTKQALEDSITQHKKLTGLDLVEETTQAYLPVKKSNDAMRDAIVDEAPLTDDAVRAILDEQTAPDTRQLVKETLQERYLSSLPEAEQSAAREYIKSGNTFKELEEAVSDRAIAEELTRLQRSEFVKEMEGRFPQLKYVPTEAGKVRAGESEVFAYLKRQGDVNLKKEYDEWAIGNTARQVLADAGVKVNPNADILGKTIVNFATDRMFGFKVMDERYGSDLLQDFYDVNTNFNLFTGLKQKAGNEIADIFKVAKKNGLHKKAAQVEILTKLRAGQYDQLTPEQKQLADAMRSFFEGKREFFNTAKGDNYSPLNIPFREDFVAPQMMVTPVEYVIRMNKKLGEVKQLLPNLDTMGTDEFMRQVNVRPELAQLKQGLEVGTELPITSGRELATAFQDATQKGASDPKMYKLASTLMPRQGAIPDFLLENNIFKLMTNYVEGTGRSLYLREPLSRMAEKAKTLEQVGATQEAKFVNRFIQDNMGIRQYSMAKIGNQARIAFADKADKLLRKYIQDEEQRESVIAGLRFLPELAANIQYNIYPNVLGLNPRAHLAQLTQVLFKTAPELGGTYGYESAVKSMLSAVVNLATKEGRAKYLSRVTELGLEPKGFVREAREGLVEGLQSSIMFSVPAKALRALADAFMYTYGKMDTINRAITIDMSERLVRDIASGNREALRVVQKMPVSVQKKIAANMDKPDAQLKAIATHLNAATQFNYNRASMSELGVTLGPMFSTFTKWPLAISGDILADMRTKGVFKSMPRIAEKYATIFALAMAVDSLVHSSLTGEDAQANPDFKELSDRAKRIFGAGGFRTMTPVASLQAFRPSKTEKNLFTPPVVDTFYNGVVGPMLDGDTEALARGGMRFLTTFAPGAFLQRFIMNDIPTMFGEGEKPATLDDSLQFYGL